MTAAGRRGAAGLRCNARARACCDDGNAIVEFVYLAVLLMVPLAYVLLTVFRVQAAAYAVSSATREAGRVFATSASVEDAPERAFAAASIVMRDSNLPLDRRDLRVTCSSSPCLAPGSSIEVVLAYDVTLPFLPRVLAGEAPATVEVSGRHLELVDRYREAAR